MPAGYSSAIPRTRIYLDDEIVVPPTEKPVNHLHPERVWHTTDVVTAYAIHFIDEHLRKYRGTYGRIGRDRGPRSPSGKPRDVGPKVRPDLELGPWVGESRQRAFPMYEKYNHQGGIATPLIVHWPAGIGISFATMSPPLPSHCLVGSTLLTHACMHIT